MSQYHPNSPSSAGGRAWWPGTGSIVGGIQSLATHPADESPGTPPSPADESTGTPPSPADESTGTPPPPADESTGTPPSPADIATLAQFMQKKLAAAKKPVDYEDFKEMQHAVLARLIAFNRRRPGELQVLRCVCYSNEMMKHLEYHVNCHILSPLMYQLKVVLNYL